MSETAPRDKTSKLLAKVRQRALAYPETTEEFPWGDRVVKVKGKVFVFMGDDENGHFSCSLKLPRSHALALELPFASPTRYGLGKSGWVSLRGKELQKAPFAMLEEWLDESYRAVAPKTVLKKLDAAEEPATKKPTKVPPRKAGKQERTGQSRGERRRSTR